MGMVRRSSVLSTTDGNGRGRFNVGLELMGMGRVDQVFVYNQC